MYYKVKYINETCLSHTFICRLCPVGESSSGKASRSLAQHIPGPGGIEGVKGAASGVVGELARARLALDERGQKLSDVEERTAAMLSSADSFSKHAHEVCLSNKYLIKQGKQLGIACMKITVFYNCPLYMSNS